MIGTSRSSPGAIACASVNDAFVMGAWAHDQKTGGKIRMLGDGSADYTNAIGLELDLTARGMGIAFGDE